ncbi:hypothetical protein ACOSQ4_028824 [Xanthoceras sorbifolium]
MQDLVVYSNSQSYKTLEDCHFDGILTQYALSNIDDGGELKGRFNRSCFGHFLRMDRDTSLSGVLAHELLLKEI